MSSLTASLDKTLIPVYGFVAHAKFIPGEKRIKIGAHGAKVCIANCCLCSSLTTWIAMPSRDSHDAKQHMMRKLQVRNKHKEQVQIARLKQSSRRFIAFKRQKLLFAPSFQRQASYRHILQGVLRNGRYREGFLEGGVSKPASTGNKGQVKAR